MIILGFNLLGMLTQMNATFPTGIFQTLRKIEHKTLTPIIIGSITFFLPCGFTQSMQVAALSSGSFFGGGSIMLAFVLGTFPMLALLSFGVSGFSQSRYAELFFKTAGVVVIGL
ncbi:sulfite exporter TauE/SafE family protein [Candidatus Peribacteria bacterium]|nr:sulfite exporter TauE/SafE family protein [Candidatus Peribacteria bacterium]